MATELCGNFQGLPAFNYIYISTFQFNVTQKSGVRKNHQMAIKRPIKQSQTMTLYHESLSFQSWA